MIHDQSILHEYYYQLFGTLLEYDHSNRTQLMHTLESYLDHSVKLSTTAKALFIHENTLKYRLDKIKGLLGINLSDWKEQVRLEIGFMIGRIINSQT